jgi:NDP-hexose-3-ketoreductase
LAAGKHVFVEKSLTTSARGARELVEAASARGLALVENFMFLHHARHRRVLQLLDAGVVGEPHVVTSAFGIPPRRADDIRYAADLGGGALLDVGAYPARAALSFLGPDLAVAGASLRHDATRGVDVAGAATLHTPAGACAQIAFGFEHYYQCRYEIWGSAARLIVDRAFTAPASLPSVIRVERQNHVEEFTLPPDDQVANAVRAFAALVRGEGDRAEQYAAALRQAELLEAIATSAAPDQPSADLPSGVEHVR